MRMRALFQDQTMAEPLIVVEEDLEEYLTKQSGCLWLDIQMEGQGHGEVLLEKVFGFHPLAIEDALHDSHVPKVDDWDEYLYVVLHTITTLREDGTLDTSEIDVFVGRRFLVTYQSSVVSAVEKVWQRAVEGRTLLQKGPARILYRIVDEAESSNAPYLDEMDGRISDLEDELFNGAAESLLPEMLALKRSLLGLRRTFVPQQEMLAKLARTRYEIFSDEERMYFHDVYDHMLQHSGRLENLRDLLNSTLEIHLSTVSNRLNEVLKTLTIITTLFMPLTFIVGFFGMNFFQAGDALTNWTGKVPFAIVLGAMILLPLIMYWWIQRRTRI